MAAVLWPGTSLWNGPNGFALFSGVRPTVPKTFHFDGHQLRPTPFAKGEVTSHGSPGGALTVSSDGAQAGTGVLWATATNGHSADHGNARRRSPCFNAQTLQEIWNSEEMPTRDRMGTLVKFAPPLVIGGKVYVPNYDDAVNVYGLLSQ